MSQNLGKIEANSVAEELSRLWAELGVNEVTWTQFIGRIMAIKHEEIDPAGVMSVFGPDPIIDLGQALTEGFRFLLTEGFLSLNGVTGPRNINPKDRIGRTEKLRAMGY